MADKDVLLELQQAIKSRQSVVFLNGGEPCATLSAATHLRLSNDTVIPKSSPTRIRRAANDITDWKAHPEAFYSAGAIYIAWVSKDASVADYLKQAREAGLVAFVSVTDRKFVVDWLEGRIQEHDRIVPLAGEAGPQTPQRTNISLPDSSPSRGANVTATKTPEKRSYIPDAQDVQVVKKIKLGEIELRDSRTVLRGSKLNNFSTVKALLTERVKSAKDAAKPSTSATAKPDPKAPAKKARNMAPIIMISSSPTSLITMHNVRKFLEEASFESPQDARARSLTEGNHRLEDVIPVYRKKNVTGFGPNEATSERSIKYFVVDGVEALQKFGPDAWDRVVCVMTTGQAWQFRPYKWSDPRALFHNVKGIYVTWSNDPPNPKIKDWNVSELKIDQHRRHVDKSTVASFWRELDAWILTNKPWLTT